MKNLSFDDLAVLNIIYLQSQQNSNFFNSLLWIDQNWIWKWKKWTQIWVHFFKFSNFQNRWNLNVPNFVNFFQKFGPTFYKKFSIFCDRMKKLWSIFCACDCFCKKLMISNMCPRWNFCQIFIHFNLSICTARPGSTSEVGHEDTAKTGQKTNRSFLSCGTGPVLKPQIFSKFRDREKVKKWIWDIWFFECAQKQ